MTLQEFMNTSLMRDAKLVAGADGLENDVTWCVPDCALKFDAWIMPGMLMLYTGTHKGMSCVECYEGVPESARISGVVLFGTASVTAIDEATCAYFDAHKTPLIALPKADNPLTFSKRFVSVITNFFDSEHHKSEWLRELCHSGYALGGEAEAEEYGYKAEYNYCCMMVEVRKLKDDSLLKKESRYTDVRNMLVRDLSINQAQALAFFNKNFLIVFVPWHQSQGNTVPYRHIERVITRVRNEVTDCKWSFSVGTTALTLGEFRSSYLNAMKTAKVIRALSVHEKVSFYDDWYMHMFLLRESKRELYKQMEQSLGPILDSKELLDTLSTYLTLGENLKATSEELHVHVNTLKYRLQRISDLTRCDLKDPNVRFRFRMAITVERYLRYNLAKDPELKFK